MNYKKIEYSTNDYRIKSFHKSDRPDKMYYVVIGNINGECDTEKIYFGGMKYKNGKWIPLGIYRDSTPLGLYKDSEHNDVDRLNKYIKRHLPFDFSTYNSNMLNLIYLWS